MTELELQTELVLETDTEPDVVYVGDPGVFVNVESIELV